MLFNSADLFGASPPSGVPVTRQETAVASGPPSASKTAPTTIWLGMFLALVLLRILWEYSPTK